MPVYGGDVDIPNVSLHDYVWENMLEHGDDIALVKALIFMIRECYAAIYLMNLFVELS